MGNRTALIAINDTHCAGSTGLFPPEGAMLDDGQRVMPSEFQLWLWDRYLDTLRRAEEITRGYRRYLLINGDVVDGIHHNTWQIISSNPETQRRIALECLKPVLSMNPERILFVRGTEAHGGQQGNIEEALARELGAHPNKATGCFSHWGYYGTIAGKVIKVFHHGKLGQKPWTEQGALQNLAWATRASYDRAGMRPPDLVFVGHLHKWGDSGEFSCPTRVLMAPGWQGPTSHVHKIDGAGAGLVPVGVWVVLLEEGQRPVCVPIRNEIQATEPDRLDAFEDDRALETYV